MTTGIIARKIGMTRIFDEAGQAIPVTVLQAGPCTVTEVRTSERDGYSATQLGFGEAKAKAVAKPQRVAAEKLGVGLTRTRMEFPGMGGLTVGSTVGADVFAAGDTVKTRSKTKGKGFQGVIKRHKFAGGAATHGNSLSHRTPGSHGNRMTPGFVFPNMRAAGHMGDKFRTTTNLKVVRVDAERNLLYVRGAVSGANGSVIKVTKMG